MGLQKSLFAYYGEHVRIFLFWVRPNKNLYNFYWFGQNLWVLPALIRYYLISLFFCFFFAMAFSSFFKYRVITRHICFKMSYLYVSFRAGSRHDIPNWHVMRRCWKKYDALCASIGKKLSPEKKENVPNYRIIKNESLKNYLTCN